MKPQDESPLPYAPHLRCLPRTKNGSNAPLRSPLTAASLQALRQEYTNTIAPARTLAAEALQLECMLNDLVNQAYGLTPEEIDLMWKTAPPRMPIPDSGGINQTLNLYGE